MLCPTNHNNGTLGLVFTDNGIGSFSQRKKDWEFQGCNYQDKSQSLWWACLLYFSN